VRADRAAQLRGLIARLPPMHREIVDLVYYQEQRSGRRPRCSACPRARWRPACSPPASTSPACLRKPASARASP